MKAIILRAVPKGGVSKNEAISCGASLLSRLLRAREGQAELVPDIDQRIDEFRDQFVVVER